MGFAPSAGWAHALTEVCAERAALPTDREVKFGKPPPCQFPVWGAIIDDVWAIDEVYSGDEGEDVSIPKHWMDCMDRAWRDCGIEVNSKKNVDRGCAEVQGVTLETHLHWLGACE